MRWSVTSYPHRTQTFPLGGTQVFYAVFHQDTVGCPFAIGGQELAQVGARRLGLKLAMHTHGLYRYMRIKMAVQPHVTQHTA